MRNKFKKGATSFYIVAFSTLILLIVATSFAAIIISEIERTSNDDLSQSAYDSALAGIEDAKLAFYNYQNCLAQGDGMEAQCEEVVNLMKNPSCDMVGKVLGRVDSGEVQIQETSSGGAQNNMQQAYTCVKVTTELPDYRSTLSSAVQYKVVKLNFADGTDASQIKKMKISWYTNDGDTAFRFENTPAGRVQFPAMKAAAYAVPPTISVALVQTAENFSFDQFATTQGNTTNRGMVYLVPANEALEDDIDSSKPTHKSAEWDGEKEVNKIGKEAFLKSNDKTATNYPYTVNCSGRNEFACSAMIGIPEPVGGTRSNDTFMIVVALPYGQPTTDIAMEFYCGDEGSGCATETYTDKTGETQTRTTNRVSLDGVQVKVDSTGRANDLYRRIETRLESGANDANLAVMGPLELFSDDSSGGGSGGSGNETLKKTDVVKSEWNF